MTDYDAEQEMEVEALQAILMDDLQELEENQWPSGWSGITKAWRVVIVPMEDGEPLNTGDDALRMELVFAHTPHYPDEPPLFKPRSLRGLADADLALLAQQLDEVVQESLGMAMVYTLITAAQEWLREKVSATVEVVLSPEEQRKRAEEEEERRIAEVRKYGTPVTPASFNEWLARFRAERALEASKLGEAAAIADRRSRMTGRQWFKQQESAGVEVSEEPDDDEDDYAAEVARDEALRRKAAAEGGGGGDEEEEEEEDDEEDFLDDYLAAKA